MYNIYIYIYATATLTGHCYRVGASDVTRHYHKSRGPSIFARILLHDRASVRTVIIVRPPGVRTRGTSLLAYDLQLYNITYATGSKSMIFNLAQKRILAVRYITVKVHRGTYVQNDSFSFRFVSNLLGAPGVYVYYTVLGYNNRRNDLYSLHVRIRTTDVSQCRYLSW